MLIEYTQTHIWHIFIYMIKLEINMAVCACTRGAKNECYTVAMWFTYWQCQFIHTKLNTQQHSHHTFINHLTLGSFHLYLFEIPNFLCCRFNICCTKQSKTQLQAASSHMRVFCVMPAFQITNKILKWAKRFRFFRLSFRGRKISKNKF